MNFPRASLRRVSRRALILLAANVSALCIAATPMVTPAPSVADAAHETLPADSVYQLGVPLVDQDGRKLPLDAYRGGVVIVSMFYTSCKFVCPMLIDAVRDTQAKLSAEEKARVPVLFVSFDPAHDSVSVLKRTADQRELDSAQWTLARTDAKEVRKLAAVLGVQYRAIGSGDFNHTAALILLDAEGRIAGRTARLSGADAGFVKLVKATLKSTAH